MREGSRRFGERKGAGLGTAFLGLLIVGVGQADDDRPLDASGPGPFKTNLPQSLVATSPASKPLNLLLTQAELRTIIRNYEIKTGEVLTAPIDDDEVVVVAPAWQAPMRDSSQDAWGGIAAPFWAIMHPKDAWRIFVPIPPRGDQKEAEPPAPDPR